MYANTIFSASENQIGVAWGGGEEAGGHGGTSVLKMSSWEEACLEDVRARRAEVGGCSGAGPQGKAGDVLCGPRKHNTTKEQQAPSILSPRAVLPCPSLTPALGGEGNREKKPDVLAKSARAETLHWTSPHSRAALQMTLIYPV